MPTQVMESIFSRARDAKRHIILPEGDDPRVQRAGIQAAATCLADITLIGNAQAIQSVIAAEATEGARPTVVDASDNADFDALTNALHDLRAHRGMTAQEARRQIADPVMQAAMRVRLGMAGGTVGGAVNTTAHIVRTALQLIGRAQGVNTVSSFFLMVPPAYHPTMDSAVIFSDCGLVVAPDAAQLAEIGISAANTASALLDVTPQVAFLSFSTAGSAEHPALATVREAVAMARTHAPHLQIDGEFQFDTAFDDTVRAKKAPNSTLDRRPDVFVFPDLAAGNIGYKIAERIGGLRAVGPILQGLAKPANDLSRGCCVDDIIAAIAITALQVEDAVAATPD
ncbi:MAG: phosphate acetyltransferase [Pseudomonadota bacterium]